MELNIVNVWSDNKKSNFIDELIHNLSDDEVYVEHQYNSYNTLLESKWRKRIVSHRGIKVAYIESLFNFIEPDKPLKTEWKTKKVYVWIGDKWHFIGIRFVYESTPISARDNILKEMRKRGESWDDIVDLVYDKEIESREYFAGWNWYDYPYKLIMENSPKYIVKTKEWIYFPVCYDGSVWCGSLPLNLANPKYEFDEIGGGGF